MPRLRPVPDAELLAIARAVLNGKGYNQIRPELNSGRMHQLFQAALQKTYAHEPYNLQTHIDYASKRRSMYVARDNRQFWLAKLKEWATREGIE